MDAKSTKQQQLSSLELEFDDKNVSVVPSFSFISP